MGGLSAVAVCAPSERFLSIGGPLAVGLGVVFASSLGKCLYNKFQSLIDIIIFIIYITEQVGEALILLIHISRCLCKKKNLGFPDISVVFFSLSG